MDVRPDSDEPPSRGVRPDGGQSRPDWKLPALRCGLEVALLVLIAAYLWVTLESELLSGVVAVLGIVGAVGVLLYYVNRQAFAWVRYASARSRRTRRQREQSQRRERQRETRQSGDRRSGD